MSPFYVSALHGTGRHATARVTVVLAVDAGRRKSQFGRDMHAVTLEGAFAAV